MAADGIASGNISELSEEAFKELLSEVIDLQQEDRKQNQLL